MSKPVGSRVVLPVDPAAAFALRTSEAWVVAKAARLQDGSRLQERATDAGGGVEMLLLRNVPSGVPALFRRFVPADGLVVQRERWSADADEGFTVAWSLGFEGAPGSVSGEGRLRPEGDGSALELQGVAQVSVPVIGGKAESFLVPLVEGIMQQEGDLLASLLAEDG